MSRIVCVEEDVLWGIGVCEKEVEEGFLSNRLVCVEEDILLEIGVCEKEEEVEGFFFIQ